MNKLVEKLADLKFRHKIAQDKVEKAINDEELNAASEEVRSLAKEISDTETEIANVEKHNEEFRNQELGGKGKMGVVYKRDNETNLEYRKKFMEAIRSFNLNNLEKRADAYTHTSDVEIVIPENLVNDIVMEVENRGYILSRVNKTNFAIGQKIPVGMTAIVATWVGTADNPTGEGLGSEVQKSGVTTYVQFSNHKLRCVVGLTYEADLQSLEVFERKFVEKVSNAMVDAIEKAIISGDGINQPKGILLETPKTAKQKLTLAAAEEFNFKNLVKFVNAVPAKYRAGAVIFATQATFYEWMSVTDTVGQPVARVNYGLKDGVATNTLLGMPVVFADEYLQDYVEGGGDADNIFAFIYNFNEYTLNTNYNLGIAERTVWENENREIKAVMAVDGKAVTINSLVTWTKSKKA